MYLRSTGYNSLQVFFEFGNTFLQFLGPVRCLKNPLQFTAVLWGFPPKFWFSGPEELGLTILCLQYGGASFYENFNLTGDFLAKVVIYLLR